MMDKGSRWRSLARVMRSCTYLGGLTLLEHAYAEQRRRRARERAVDPHDAVGAQRGDGALARGRRRAGSGLERRPARGGGELGFNVPDDAAAASSSAQQRLAGARPATRRMCVAHAETSADVQPSADDQNGAEQGGRGGPFSGGHTLLVQ